MKDHVLVTGGAGFIGSHLVERLLRDGRRVIVVDDLSTGSMDNLSAVSGHPDLDVVTGSLLDRATLDQQMSRAGIVVHLAAGVGVRLVLDRWYDTLMANQMGCHAVLESASAHGSAVFLASTSEVYGMNPAAPLTETDNLLIGPPRIARWSYALAKAIGEATAHAFRAEFGLTVTVLRLFNTVGPRQSADYGMVIPRLVRQALSGEPLTVYGDGQQTRCFCHVADAVDAITGLLDHPKAPGETFNIGTGDEISIDALARLITGLTGSLSPIVYLPYGQAFSHGFADMARRVPDTSKLRATTGWTPVRSLTQVLQDVVASMPVIARPRPPDHPIGGAYVRGTDRS